MILIEPLKLLYPGVSVLRIPYRMFMGSGLTKQPQAYDPQSRSSDIVCDNFDELKSAFAALMESECSERLPGALRPSIRSSSDQVL